jgi:hypothetical protein
MIMGKQCQGGRRKKLGSWPREEPEHIVRDRGCHMGAETARA